MNLELLLYSINSKKTVSHLKIKVCLYLTLLIVFIWLLWSTTTTRDFRTYHNITRKRRLLSSSQDHHPQPGQTELNHTNSVIPRKGKHLQGDCKQGLLGQIQCHCHRRNSIYRYSVNIVVCHIWKQNPSKNWVLINFKL